MDITPVRLHAKPADILVVSGHGALSALIKNGQIPHTLTGKPSLFSHCLMYQDSKTVLESTIDFRPYLPTGKKLDNGPQMNDFKTLKNYDYGILFCFNNLINNNQRQKMLNKAQEIINDPDSRYDITGLVGSLLTYWALPWMHTNPLSTGLYCSAFLSKLLNAIHLDPSNNSDKNTSPEQLYQWLLAFGCTPYQLAKEIK